MDRGPIAKYKVYPDFITAPTMGGLADKELRNGAMSVLDPITETPSESLVDVATNAIRDSILDLSLPPGESIDHKWLIVKLNLSRTPIREALNRLAAEGLIHFKTNQGVYVHSLDVNEISQLLDAFRVCERISAHFCDFTDPRLLPDVLDMQERQRMALHDHRYLDASYWNFAFRLRIAETCRNHHLVEFYKRTANHTRRLSVMIYIIEARDPNYYESQIHMLEGLHSDVVEAIREADRDRLLRVLTEQVDVMRRRVTAVLKGEGADFPVG